MLPSIRTIALSRKYLQAYAVGAVLLVISSFGFIWGVSSHENPDQSVPWPLIELVVLGVMPLVLFVFIAVRLAMSIGQRISSAGFQFRIDQLQKRLNEQDDFFRAINDYTPSALMIFDNSNTYWFVNAAAAHELGSSDNNILGKKPSAILGFDAGRKVEKNLDTVRANNAPLETLNHGKDKQGQPRYVQISYQPLAAFGEFPGGVLAREENITNILVERERRESMLRQVISTLVAVVDRRDPYAAGHSARVGQLSRALAVELQLPDREIDAAEIAGSLMNFGKVLVSRSILTKTESLTPDELQRIRDGILTSADILSLIDFSTPVVPILRQVFERYDGTGSPRALQGDAILITTRIVVVANAFVAMVSPRAYRPGAEFSVAAQRLANDAGKAFDPRVITALESFLTKNKSRLEWLAVTQPVTTAAKA